MEDVGLSGSDRSEKDRSSLIKDVLDLLADIAEKNRNIVSDVSISEIKKNITKLEDERNRFKDLSERLANVSADSAELYVELEEKNDQLSVATARASELVAELELKNEALDDANKELARANAHASELMAEIELKNDEIKNLNRSLSEANAHAAELVAELDEKKAEIIETKKISQEKGMLLKTYMGITNRIFVEIGRDEKIRMINPAGCKILGYDEEELVGKNWFEIALPDNIREDVRKMFRGMINGKRDDVENFENDVLTRSGETRTIDWHNSYIRDEEGSISATISSGEDATESKLLKNRLMESEERFRGIFDKSPLGIYQTAPSGEIKIANSTLVKLLDYDSLDDLKQINLNEYGYLDEKGRDEFRSRIDQAGEVSGFEQSWKKKDGSVIHVNEFSWAIRDTSGEIIAYEGIVQDISEEWKMKRKLEETHEQLMRAQRLAHVGSWTLDLDSNIFSGSEETSSILGSKDEKIEMDYHQLVDYIHPDDKEGFSEWFHDWLEMGGYENGEFKLITRDAEVKYILISGEMVIKEEGGSYLTGALLDFTDLKNAHLEIEENESKMRAILDNIQAGVVIIESNGCSILEANPKALQMIGLSKEEVIGRRCNNFICPKDINECPILDYGQEVDNSEKVIINKDGDHIPILKTVTPIRLSGKDCLLESFVDISAMKDAKEELRVSREQYELAVKGSNDGIWDWNIVTNEVYFSPRWKEMIGYKEDELENTFETFIGLIHPDDQENANSYIQEYLGKGEGKYDIEFRFGHKDGSYRWIQSRGQAIRDQDGNAIRMAGSHSDITERKESEQKLKESQELLSSFMQSATDGIILLDKDLQVLIANEGGFDRFDVPPEEAIGKRISELTLLEEGGERFNAYRKTIETGEPYEIPELIWNWTPGVPQYSLKAFKVGEGLGLIISDITYIKEMEYEANEQKAYMDDLFEGAPEGIAVLDSDDIIHNVNKEFTVMFGFTKEESIGRSIKDLIIPEGKEDESQDLTNKVVEGKTVYNESHRKMKTGELVDVSILGTPINLSDGETRTYAIYRDIREDIKQRRELEEAKEIAEEAARSKSEFLANMSHEIRTPMNAILGFTDILIEQDMTDKQRTFLNSIRSSGKTLLTLINDILDLSKIDAGKLELNYRSADPHAIFNEMKQIFHKKVSDKGIGFDVEVSELVPRSLIIDEVRLRQILLNLAGNAVKFTEEGGIKLSVDRTNIEEDGSMIDLRFSVKDSGIGIPTDQKDKIFGTFEQMKGQDSGKYGGTGLGLAITKRLVEMMNGKIWVESKVGKGSEFIVEFYQVAVGSTFESETASGQHVDYTFNDPMVLIVDDIEQNRILVKGLLDGRGLKFMEAENGKVAIDLLREGGIDLVLMDMKMPVMTGYEATRTIKADESLKEVPIIALTASAMEGDREKIIEMGCNGYLRKPVNRDSLLIELGKFLPHDEGEILSDHGTGPDTGEAFTDDPEIITKHLPSLIGELKLRVGSALETGSMDDAMELADDLIKFGSENQLQTVGEWGARLMELVDGFDIEGMIDHMNGYDIYISRLQAHAVGEGA